MSKFSDLSKVDGVGYIDSKNGYPVFMIKEVPGEFEVAKFAEKAVVTIEGFILTILNHDDQGHVYDGKYKKRYLTVGKSNE